MFGPFFLWGCQKLQLFYLLLVLSLKVLIIRRIGFLENEESNSLKTTSSPINRRVVFSKAILGKQTLSSKTIGSPRLDA